MKIEYLTCEHGREVLAETPNATQSDGLAEGLVARLGQ
jgi:hypothetical protein